MIEPKDMRLEDMLAANVTLEEDQSDHEPEVSCGTSSHNAVWYRVDWHGGHSGCRCGEPCEGKLIFSVPLLEAFGLADGVRATCGLPPKPFTLIEKGKAVLFFYYINQAIELLK